MSKPQLEVLTSLRFPAAMLVFLHHVGGHLGVPNHAFPFRAICVTFFFVLSGYLLFSIYGRPGREFSISRFYCRRASRIYPLHLAVLLLSLALLWPREMHLFRADAQAWLWENGAQATLLQCWLPNLQFMNSLGVTWSLSVILFFYAAFPLLLKCQKHLGKILLLNVLGGGAILASIEHWSGIPWFQALNARDLVHYFPLFRLPEFILGMIAARQVWRDSIEPLAERQGPATWCDVGLLVACGAAWLGLEQAVFDSGLGQVQPADEYLAPDSAVAPGSAVASGAELDRAMQTSAGSLPQALLAWAFFSGFSLPAAVIIVWFASSSGGLARILQGRRLVFLGNLSFAFYLCHRPVILWTERALAPYGWGAPTSMAICLAIALALSAMVHLLVERPADHFFRRGSSSPRTPLPAAGRAHLGREGGGWILLAGGATLILLMSTAWPPSKRIVFANGLTVYVNGVVKRDDQHVISLAWNASRPIAGRLLAFHAGDLGWVHRRIRVANFDHAGENTLVGSGRVRITSSESDLGEAVSLAFFSTGESQAVEVVEGIDQPSCYGRIWSRGSTDSRSLHWANGLRVEIDRLERINDFLALEMSWKNAYAVEGQLLARSIDDEQQVVAEQVVHQFRVAGDSRAWARQRLSLPAVGEPVSLVLGFRNPAAELADPINDQREFQEFLLRRVDFRGENGAAQD